MGINLKSRQKIAVALSGGVDSAVAAALLKEQGYQLIGVFMDCRQKGTECRADKDRQDALRAASHLKIPFRVFDFRREYRQQVLNYFYREYQKGRTPNPDILCNQKIKFGLFMKKSLKSLGVSHIATGHYAHIEQENSSFRLFQAQDKSKDQSYFLYRLNQDQLAHAIFPLGKITKKQVRQKAKKLGLSNWNRPDSQGICFIGEVDLFNFLRQRIKEKEGFVVNAKGQKIGRHKGIWFYTIGQRHGFTINRYQGTPLYVIDKDIKNNLLIVGKRKEAYRQKFAVEDLSWVSGRPFTGECLIRIRHLGELIPGSIYPDSDLKKDLYHVKLKKAVFAVAPGQSAVFMSPPKNKRIEVLGGGIILNPSQPLLSESLI
ncbi:tRNA 2-thiouridine(34) synthase MnmA [candidate division CPR3 bacterium 4484_211]|uniref:tRNA-specific 2-thiouridylase MnmA n=1 Tax=candidate division CPR3 bacterium 4484_211 TaxID=1968527 RepID=A0A1W9NXB7_UNCC3|nr:MAG: tRNA 2-thiouridine(34) synthase MnmA [candidate division CPR3 bacterium 4484_211]